MSLRRTCWLLMKYSDWPLRVSTRLTDSSVYCDHCPAMRPSELSKTSSTAARDTGLRPPEPLKMTSCIDSPRNSEALDSPSTQRTASITFDLPHPFGPTTPTSCPGREIVVGSTKDLKPASLSFVRRMKENAACRLRDTISGR